MTQQFNGLTPEQVSRLLEQIATTVNLACDICRNEADRFSDHQSSYTLHALETMLCGVGALADLPGGGGVVGDFPAWLCGPLFNQAQSAGGAA